MPDWRNEPDWDNEDTLTPELADRLDALEVALERNQLILEDIIGLLEGSHGIRPRRPRHLSVVESP